MHLPKVPFITKKTKSFLKWKTLLYLASLREGRHFFYYYIFKVPKLFIRFLFSFVAPKKTSKREGDYFFYGCSSFDDIRKLYKKTNVVLVLGFSYCQKPLKCPSGRFNDQCYRDLSHPACKNCIIGEVKNKFPVCRAKVIIIPTFLYVAEFLCKEKKKFPNKDFIFLITACELSFKMFERYVGLLQLKGIGIRLQGRICNTFQAFKFAEHGIKPGLTIISSLVEEELKKLLYVLMKCT